MMKEQFDICRDINKALHDQDPDGVISAVAHYFQSLRLVADPELVSEIPCAGRPDEFQVGLATHTDSLARDDH